MLCKRKTTPHYRCQIDKKRCHLPNGGDCYKVGKAKKTRPVLSNSTDWLAAGYLVEWGRASIYKKTKKEAKQTAGCVNKDDSGFVAVIIPLFKQRS